MQLQKKVEVGIVQKNTKDQNRSKKKCKQKLKKTHHLTLKLLKNRKEIFLQ